MTVRTGTHLLSILKYLEKHPRTSEKLEFLGQVKDAPFVQQMFAYAIDPYMRFNLRRLDTYIQTGFDDLDIRSFQLLGKLARRLYTGATARDEVMNHVRGLDPDSAQVFIRILKKDLNCGVSTKLVNRIWPGMIPEFDCQLVEEFDPRRVKYPVYVSPKLDGIRAEYRGGTIYTRKGHIISGTSHIISAIKLVAKNVKLSGELWVPGWHFEDISGYVRSKASTKPKLKYAIFSIVTDAPMSFKERLGMLQQMFRPLGHALDLPTSYIPHFEAHNRTMLDSYYRTFVDQRFEGLVIKNPTSHHYDGKNYDWMRLVPEGSGEFKIIDMEESEERPGELGAVWITVGSGKCKVGSGFSASQRKRYWDTPADIIGRWATIKYKEKTVDGLLRQPIFKEIRWDI